MDFFQAQGQRPPLSLRRQLARRQSGAACGGGRLLDRPQGSQEAKAWSTLGVDSFFILFNHRSFLKNWICFPWVFDGFLKRRIPGKNGEVTPPELHDFPRRFISGMCGRWNQRNELMWMHHRATCRPPAIVFLFAFTRNAIQPILLTEIQSCSWRTAGALHDAQTQRFSVHGVPYDHCPLGYWVRSCFGLNSRLRVLVIVIPAWRRPFATPHQRTASRGFFGRP